MSKDTPDPPDYRGAAEETAQANLDLLHEQTRANRPTQVTPFGTSSWTQDEAGDWTQNVQLTPEQQQALSSQMGIQQGRSELAGNLMGRVGEEFGDVMDWDKFNQYANVDQDTGAVRQRAEDALYGRATSRLDPQFAQRREQSEAALRNQGLRPGDEAYDTAMANLGREETDAYNQANFGSIIAGGGEAERQQGMSTQAAAFNNQLRGTKIAEEMQRRGFSLNEINAILTGQQVGLPSMPQFNQAGRTQGADYTGAARDRYGADMDQFNAEQQFINSAMSGAGSAAMMFSDRRLKRNIHKVGSVDGRTFYTWEWIWGGKGFGIIAQENLDLVAVHPSGYLMVDYGRL
jgi:hypothetical protein